MRPKLCPIQKWVTIYSNTRRKRITHLEKRRYIFLDREIVPSYSKLKVVHYYWCQLLIHECLEAILCDHLLVIRTNHILVSKWISFTFTFPAKICNFIRGEFDNNASQITFLNQAHFRKLFQCYNYYNLEKKAVEFR